MWDKEVGTQQGLRPAVAAAAMRVLCMRLLGVVCRHGGRGAGRLQHEVRRLAMLQPARCGRARSCAGPRQWQAKEQQKGKQAGTHDGRIVRGESGWAGAGVRVLGPPIRGFTVRGVGHAMACGSCCSAIHSQARWRCWRLRHSIFYLDVYVCCAAMAAHRMRDRNDYFFPRCRLSEQVMKALDAVRRYLGLAGRFIAAKPACIFRSSLQQLRGQANDLLKNHLQSI